VPVAQGAATCIPSRALGLFPLVSPAGCRSHLARTPVVIPRSPRRRGGGDRGICFRFREPALLRFSYGFSPHNLACNRLCIRVNREFKLNLQRVEVQISLSTFCQLSMTHVPTPRHTASEGESHQGPKATGPHKRKTRRLRPTPEVGRFEGVLPAVCSCRLEDVFTRSNHRGSGGIRSQCFQLNPRENS
jgi:hypothetical protein